MFIAMNRFRVRRGREEEFETMWKNRDTHLREVPGFVRFDLLRGPEQDDHTVYASHTVWRSHEDFTDWTQSEAFRQAHRSAGQHRDMYLEGPRFEGFESIQTIE